MATVAETIAEIVAAPNWDQRVARFRLVPQRHGTADHSAIYATVARELYVQDLAPDFAHIHFPAFYDLDYFEDVYREAAGETDGFTRTTADDLASVLQNQPRTLLVLRTMLGLTKAEFARSTTIVGEALDLPGITGGKADSMERRGSGVSASQARVVATTIARVMAGTLFGDPAGNLRSKQAKPDTAEGWQTVRRFAAQGVPYSAFLHQRHYGGAFRQVLDATSSLRGDLIEEAVQALLREYKVPHIRTGGHNQAELEVRFEVRVVLRPTS